MHRQLALKVSASSMTGLLTLAITVAGINPCFADDAATRKAIDKQYAKISQALKARNFKAIDTVTAPDYTVKLSEGQVATWPQIKAQVAMQLSFLQKITSASDKITKFAVKGNEARVDVTESIAGVVGDPQTQGKVHTMVVGTQYKDTWVKSGDSWLRKHSDVLAGTLSMDGKKTDLRTLLAGPNGGGVNPGSTFGPKGATKE